MAHKSRCNVAKASMRENKDFVAVFIGNRTILIDKIDNTAGIAKCSPLDTFDKETGLAFAAKDLLHAAGYSFNGLI